MKTCSDCKRKKELAFFSKKAASPDGHMPICKACAAIRRKAHYEANKAKEREQNRKWHQDNKPWLNPDKRAYHNAWRRASDRRVEYNNRDALKRGAEGTHTVEEWYEVCERYGNKCLSCGRPDVRLTQDHVVPLALGGTNYIDNIQPLCGPCNSSKGARIIDYRRGESD